MNLEVLLSCDEVMLPNADFQMQFWPPLQVDEGKRNMLLFSFMVLAFSLGLRTYISTTMGFDV